jgi:HlyD family secretion protein
MRQNQRASVRIVLDERNDVLKFERGSFVDDATRNVFVLRGDRAVRVPVELGAASVGEVEVLRGLAPGDRVVISDMRDFDGTDQVAITR